MIRKLDRSAGIQSRAAGRQQGGCEDPRLTRLVRLAYDNPPALGRLPESRKTPSRPRPIHAHA